MVKIKSYLMNNIAIIQFPGSNTERETFMACSRVGLNAEEFLWNKDHQALNNFDGFIIVGGFSYEDRSRAGVIAALDPIMQEIKCQAHLGKPVLGICNGAQILVETGMVPGLKDYQLGAALSDNKRIKDGKVIGVGYYNVWTNLKMSSSSNRSAFTRHIKKGDAISMPIAHGEGRFLIPENLLSEMIKNEQDVYRYCDESGNIIDEFPTNPNGSIHNIAAICNPEGNIMAMMPHPERSKEGDVIFSSMKEYIEKNIPPKISTLEYEQKPLQLLQFENDKKNHEWLIDMIITDNEAITVTNALNHLGYDVKVSRQIRWEIEIENSNEIALEQIKNSGELFNSNKEFIGKPLNEDGVVSLLVCQKDDIKGRAAYESLTKRFGINKILSIKHGVLWNLKINGSNFNTILNEILTTNILFNPLSYECYRIK